MEDKNKPISTNDPDDPTDDEIFGVTQAQQAAAGDNPDPKSEFIRAGKQAETDAKESNQGNTTGQSSGSNQNQGSSQGQGH